MDTDTAQDWESTPEPATVDPEPPTGETEPDAGATAENTETTGDEKTETPDIEAQLKEIEEQKKSIAREAYEVRQLKKKLKEKESAAPTDIELTDAQFESLLQEHTGDSRMQVQIMKQMARQIAKGEKVDAVKTVELQNLKREQDNFLASNFPELAKEDSEIRRSVDRAKNILGIEDHTFSDWFAMASLNLIKMPQLIRDAEERGRQAALKGKVETKRKESIKSNQPPNGDKPPKKEEGDASNNFGLTSEQMEVAKKNFGFTKPDQFKWYAINLKTAQAR